MSKYKLTIAVLTMNRAEQLRHALESCFDSTLPAQTQFVIVDNASSDHTENVVNELKQKCTYDLIYKCLPTNRGVGGGRNECFDLAQGEYFYMLDDDAEIPQECRDSFFVKSVDYLDRNCDVMTLTTRIEDKVFGKRTPIQAKKLTKDGLPLVYLFQGGSTFLRRENFKSPLFMNIMYGHEEIPVSMHVLNDGYSNVYMSDIFINHLPAVDKWTFDKDSINVGGIINQYSIKSMLYPAIFRFPLWVAFLSRLYKYGVLNRSVLVRQKDIRKKMRKENELKKIRLSTVIVAFREFGITVF